MPLSDHKGVMIDTIERQVLDALFRLSRDNAAICSARLAREARLSPMQSTVALIALDRAGLVDVSRLRLTMAGLAAAAGLSEAHSESRTACSYWASTHQLRSGCRPAAS